MVADNTSLTIHTAAIGSRRRSGSRALMVGLGVLIGIVIVLLLPIWLPDPLAQDVAIRLQGPSATHWFGTDELGRDVLTRVVSGARVSLAISASASVSALIVGGLYGSTAALAGRKVQTVMMRVLEVVLAFPGPLLALVLSVAIGPGFVTLIIAISIVYSAPVARLTRSLVLDELKQDYVASATIIGSSRVRILFRHILINVMAPMLVYTVMVAADAVLVEAGLSYLGAGISPPTAAWGSMIQEGQTLIYGGVWWVALFAGLAIAAVVLALNTLADSIVDELRIGGRRG